MAEAIVKTLLAYLLGSVMGGSIVGRFKGGVDLRQVGSGNVGATNALRTQGKGFALAVLIIDVGKGVLAVTLLPTLPWPWISVPALPPEQQAYFCGVAAALGHIYPVFSGFRGGKGAATLTGVFATLVPPGIPWLLAAFALVLLLTGYVGLATTAGAVTALFYITCIDARGLFSPVGLFTLTMATLLIYTHRRNLLRVWRGTELRFEKAMLLKKWLGP